jgi:cell division protein FtsL
MAEKHHHHHHHKTDSAHEFKKSSLNAIVFRKKFEKILKIVLIVIAIIMAMGVVASRYLF